MIQITMPRLSDTMEDGVITTWLKQPGDKVEAGEPLVEIETDKAIMEFEAYDSGTLANVLVPEGERATIGTPIAELDDGTTDNAESAGNESQNTDEATGGGVEETSQWITEVATNVSVPTAPTPSTASRATTPATDDGEPRVRATPLVRTLARERGIDLTDVTGTGPGGRIIRADIEGALPPSPTSHVIVSPGASEAEVDERRDSEEVELSSVRRVIARRLSTSAHTIPHFYVTAVADAEELVNLRGNLNNTLIKAGRSKVSMNDLLVRACALALRAHPLVNASYRGDDAATMFVHRKVNIGIAVASEGGLVVPVIDDVDQKTVTQVSTETKMLVALANERKLSPSQMSGGTFTISNLGMYGVEDFTAIINPPEGAILAVGSTKQEPAIVDGLVGTRHRMRYTLSADHRIIDGALAAQFLQTLTGLIENPWTILA